MTMTAYKQFTLPDEKHKEHIPYGHELNSHEIELEQYVKETKTKRQQVLAEIRRRRARSRS